ncbi:nuclear fragile X mental retardation-interacting protein 1-like [Patiria miniata]|uniref:C2H2-type domain-containing protein n=1 Tax=Patiria miniata TaxID=46514 RepID=A0A913ZHD7_PATMI|nr:nuclear fragile X mental retardation-interacting protein 1-like [Patiria miniata]
MAYSFPPRGFSPASNNQQFTPNFGWPPFPPPFQQSQAPPRPPWNYSAGPDRPPFPGGGPHFGPQVPVRFANLEPFARGDHAQTPSERGGLAPGPRAAEPGAVPGEFPLQRPAGRESRSFHRSADRTRTTDITECETWPGVVGRKNRRHFPNDGQHTSKNKNGPQNYTNGGPSAWKNQRDKPSKKKRRGTGSNAAKQLQASSQLEHYCDVCDRGFKSQQLLDEHIAEHVKCNHEGCKFEAHFKVVKLHTKLQHSAGSKRVAWMDTPAAVSKWREERKRKYPSLCNITKKAEARQSNEEKGVVLQNKYFGKMRRPNQGRQRHRNFQGDDGIDTKKARMDAIQNTEDSSLEKSKSSKDKSDTAPSSPTTHHQGVVASSGQLGSLSALTAYGDSSEEEEGEIKDDAPEPEVATPPQKQSPSIRRNNGRRKVGWKGFKGRKATRCSKADRRVNNREQNDLQLRLKKRPNLLEMLLAPEIRKERNIILQCVRHVVHNDFLGVNQTKETERDSESRPPSSSEESVNIESKVESRAMIGNPTNLDVGVEDSQLNESEEKTVENAIAVQGSDWTKILDTDIAKIADEQTISQEGKEGVLKEGTNAEVAQQDDSTRNGESDIGTDAVITYREERTDGITEVNSSKIGLDVESGEALIAKGRESHIVQNGASCDKVTTDCNANPSVNGVLGVTTSIGEESNLETVENLPKLEFLFTNRQTEALF